MRAFDKLKSLVGSGSEQTNAGETERDIDALIASMEPKAETPAPPAEPKAETPADADTSSDEEDDIILLNTTTPSTGPLIKPAILAKPKPKITPPEPEPIPVAVIEPKPAPAAKPAAITPTPVEAAPKPAPALLPAPQLRKETSKPMPSPAPETKAKPSDKLSADLAALDELIMAVPAPAPAAPKKPATNLGPQRKTAGLTHMRKDLAKLNEDMSSGEQFYAQSLRRINDLIDYAYETETTLNALEQLEPENARLKDELTEAKKSLTDQVVRAESMKSKADAYEARYLETRQALEKAQLSLTQMESLRETLSREIDAKDNDLAIMINKAREIKNAHNLDIKALDDYKAKASELANELSVTMSGRLEIEQRLQDLSARYESLQSERDTLEQMVTQTRNAQRATEEHNLALKTQLETVLSDVKIFKQQFDAATQNKDAEIGLLRSKLADAGADMAVKDGVVERAHGEMAELRDKFETAHRGRRKLLEHIEGQKSETDYLQGELDKLRAEHSRLTSDFVEAQTDIESLRRVNDAQSDKLKRYTALNRKPVVRPAAFMPDTMSLSETPRAPESEIKAPEIETAAVETAAVETPELGTAIPVPPMPGADLEPPVFALSDTPPPRPETVEDAIEAVTTPQPEPITGAVADTSPETPSYPDINFDFEPEKDRRDPESPMRNAASPTTDFDREFAELAAMAPIQTDAPAAKDASDELKSDAQKIEEALLEFHDLDLLADSAG